MIASLLAGSGGAFVKAANDTFAALADAINGAGISLTDKAALSALITGVAATEGIALPKGTADAVAEVIAASNTLLDQKLLEDVTGTALLDDVYAMELVTLGAASSAIQQAAGDPAALAAIASAYTGASLDQAFAAALDQIANPAADRNFTAGGRQSALRCAAAGWTPSRSTSSSPMRP